MGITGVNSARIRYEASYGTGTPLADPFDEIVDRLGGSSASALVLGCDLSRPADQVHPSWSIPRWNDWS